MASKPSEMPSSTLVQAISGDIAALAGYPGPILEITDKDGLQAVNPAGARLVETLDLPAASAAASRLLELIKTALDQSISTRTPLAIPPEDGSGPDHWIDTIVLPLAPRRALVIGLDMTQTRQDLSVNEQRYKELVGIAADFAWETGADGAFTFISEGGALGHASAALIGKHPRALLLREPSKATVLPFNAVAQVREEEIWVRDADRNPTCLAVSAVPMRGADGRRNGSRGVCRDVTKTRLVDSTDARRRVRERVVKNVIDSVRNQPTAAAMLDTAARAICRAVDADACELFLLGEGGYAERPAAFGETGIDERYSFQLINRMDLEDLHQVVVAGRPVIGMLTGGRGIANGAVLIWRNEGDSWSEESELLMVELRDQFSVVVAQIVEQQKLETLSRFDELTGLINRRFFYEELDTRLGRSIQRRRRGALIYVDLDNFKAVNDKLGHERGDIVLRSLGDILRGNTREYDLIGRLGGDEFALWLDDTDANVALKRGENMILAARSLKNMSASREKPLAVSIGVAIFDPRGDESRDALIARADSAMYEAKGLGKGQVAMAPPTATVEKKRGKL